MADRTSWQETLGDALSPGDVIAGKYRVQRLIGRGGMGVVLEAWHLDFDEPVALKLLLPEVSANEEAVGRFEREARAAFKVKGEHVARMLDVGKTESNAPYLVMEFLEGSDLADVLAKDRRMPIGDAVDCILQACDAVAEAHAHGIVHRDLKPENLFVTKRPDGSPCLKVLDFGLSKVHGGAARERLLTATYQLMGTPHYMSPEQWMGTSDVGPASDLWALAVILYELITGVPPFRGEKLIEVCQRILETEPPPMATYVSDVPLALEEAILACLRKAPKERLGNVAELAIRIHPFAHREGRLAAKRASGVLRSAGIDVQGFIPSTTIVPPPAEAAVDDEALMTTDLSSDTSTASQVRRAHAFLALAERARKSGDEGGDGGSSARGAASADERVSVPTLLILDEVGRFGDVPVNSRTQLAVPLTAEQRARLDTPTTAFEVPRPAATAPPPSLALESPWATMKVTALGPDVELPSTALVRSDGASKPANAAAERQAPEGRALERTVVTGALGRAIGRVTLASQHRAWMGIVVGLGLLVGVLASALLVNVVSRADDAPEASPSASSTATATATAGAAPVPLPEPTHRPAGRASASIGPSTLPPSVIPSRPASLVTATPDDGTSKPPLTVGKSND
ncbi:MAG: serine/threonine protein kinase [Deltaproteobacteria bacterium]|nr:serine/threonine protein kinase [Deltaproteobacteria bacterium]